MANDCEKNPNHICTTEQLVIRVEARLVRIEDKVDDLMGFKFKIIGGSLFASAVISGLITYFSR